MSENVLDCAPHRTVVRALLQRVSPGSRHEQLCMQALHRSFNVAHALLATGHVKQFPGTAESPVMVVVRMLPS